MVDLGLQGQHAVVAGAGYIPTRAGHGRAVALRLAEAGASVACIDIDTDRAAGIVAEIEERGGKAYPIVADMTILEESERAIREATTCLGSIDVCVDIIGGARWAPVAEVSGADWDWTIANNLSHVFYLFQGVGRQMISQGTGGSLVALASVDGMRAASFHAPYGAAKAGVISLAQSFAQELGRYGIRVNTIAPGNVGTGNEDSPDGRYAVDRINPLAPPRTRDVANAALFLCSNLSERITGQNLVVDGGASMAELWGLTDKALTRFRTGDYG